MSNPNFTGALYTYPWDLSDEGVDDALDRIIDLTGCTEIQLAPSYHVSNYFLPHSPLAPIRFGENGAIYYRPDLSRYEATELKPYVSPTVTTHDYFERLVDAIDRKGLVFSAWNVYFFNHQLTEKHPEFAKHDAFGMPYIGQISPSSKDAQEFAVALTQEIMDRFRPHAVRVEALQRQMWRHGMLKNKFQGDITERCQFLLGVCFNPASMRNAEEAGMDAENFRRDVDAWLRAELARIPSEDDLTMPADAEWLANSFDGRLRKYLDILNTHTTDLWLRVAEVIKRGGGKVQSDYLAHGVRTDTNGLEPRINKHIDRLTAGLPASDSDAGSHMQNYLEMIAPGGEVFVPVGPGNITEAAPLVERTRAAAEAGAAGALFYNYGLMREGVLRFVGEAMRSVP
ncbi:MAG: hypothetical protein OXD46_04575 [Chloroflexi bacterium]|nr:hypothetical protein [Chloroflexota bacterium]